MQSRTKQRRFAWGKTVALLAASVTQRESSSNCSSLGAAAAASSFRPFLQQRSFSSLGQRALFLLGSSSSNGEPKNVQRGKAPPEESESGEATTTTELLLYCCSPNLVCYGLSQSILSRHQDNNKDFVCFQKCYLHSNKRYAKVGLQFHQKQIRKDSYPLVNFEAKSAPVFPYKQ